MQDKSPMHPDDIRNLLIFAFVSIFLWMGYETFIMGPQNEAMQARQQVEQQARQAALANPTPEMQLQNLSRAEIVARDSRITINNGEIEGTMSLTGGRIDDIKLEEFFETLKSEQNVTLLSPRGSEHARYMNVGWVASDKNIRVPDADTRWQVADGAALNGDNNITLFWNNDQGLRFERVVALDEKYLFTITQRVVNNSGRDITLFPYGLVSQTGLPEDMQGAFILHEGPIGWIGDELREIGYKDLRKSGQQSFEGNQGWIGVTEKYWLSALLPAQGAKTKYRFSHVPNVLDEDRGRFQMDYTGEGVFIAAGSAGQTQNHIYAGAKKVLVLQDYGEKLNVPNFDLAVDFGMFFFLTKPFFYILHFLNMHIGNMGIAIICLTIIIRMAVFPLTNMSYRSFAKMKKVAPQITKLREDHGEDKQRLQKEIIEMYQREGVNPMAGCFPILLQIPIFFALYKVFFTTIEMRHEPFFGWIQDLSAPDPTSIFNLFGLIPIDLPGFLMIGVWPCLMLLTMLVQKKLNPPPQDKLQRDMMNIFPFFITFIMAKFASGLVIYWTFSALISVLQQMYIMKSLNVPIHLFGEKEEETTDTDALAEMAEDDVEEALGLDEDDEPKQITPPKPKKSKKKKK